MKHLSKELVVCLFMVELGENKNHFNCVLHEPILKCALENFIASWNISKCTSTIFLTIYFKYIITICIPFLSTSVSYDSMKKSLPKFMHIFLKKILNRLKTREKYIQNLYFTVQTSIVNVKLLWIPLKKKSRVVLAQLSFTLNYSRIIFYYQHCIHI